MTEQTTKTILLVDDDADFRDGIRALLESRDYRVLCASGGDEGLATAKRERPDLMVLDVMMGSDTEGFDVSRAVENAPELAGMPVILLTGIRRAMNLPFGFEPDGSWLPVKAVLEKPVPPERLLKTIADILADVA